MRRSSFWLPIVLNSLALLGSALPARAQQPPEMPRLDKVEAFGYRWGVVAAPEWSFAGGVLRLLKDRQPIPGRPRKPQNYALAETEPYKKVTIELDMQPGGKSLVIIYAWQDESHFNYAHISSDAARAVNVHNGIFHVFGGERVRISPLEGPGSFPVRASGNSEAAWIPVKLVWDGATGRVAVEVNGRRNPSLEAVDLSLTEGRVGLGSFNETGGFRSLKILRVP